MTLSRAQTNEPLARSDGCCFGKLIERKRPSASSA